MKLSKQEILDELHKIIALFLGPVEVINMEKMVHNSMSDNKDKQILDCLNYLRAVTKYTLYDLEATRRERKA
ncbi:MAG: hypothetical protein WCR98_06030 [Saccharofermentanales bacterium]